jgi:hypothetical protein
MDELTCGDKGYRDMYGKKVCVHNIEGQQLPGDLNWQR